MEQITGKAAANVGLEELRQAIECFKRLDGKRTLHKIGEEVLGKRKAGNYQSRVSKLLSTLHEGLGLEDGLLCERIRGQHPTPTEAGRLFLRNCADAILKEMEERTRAVQARLDAAREEVGGSVVFKIAMVPTMDNRWLLPFMARLARNPATRHIRLNPPAIMRSAEVEQAVMEGVFKIGILHLPEEGERRKELDARYGATVLFRDPFVTAFHHKHKWARKKTVGLRDFDGVKGYYRFDGGRPAEVVERRLAGAGVKVDVVQSFGDFASVEAAVTALGDEPCVTIVPRLFVTNAHIGDGPEIVPSRPVGGMLIRPIKDFGPPREMGFIRAHGELSKEAELLLEALHKEAARG